MKVSSITDRRQESTLEALSDLSLEISAERDETEREIKRLAEAGDRDAAWKLLVKHWNIHEPRRLKVIK